MRTVPRHGIAYGVLRYLSEDPQLKQQLRYTADLRFNYLGQLGGALPPEAPYSPAAESRGPAQSADSPRSHLLAIVASVAAGRMYFHFNYSCHRHERATMERWAQDFLQALRELSAHCLAKESPEWTPSDFPLAHLDEDKLDRVAQLIARIDEEPA
jgi:non-ribosomal peptide synthase protein (TIGR01720 family)